MFLLILIFQNKELGPRTSVETLKDKLNNDNNNCEQNLIRSKCDISNRKRTPDDVLLSCIVVNNDLHGENENNNGMPITVSKTISGVKFTPSQNNR